MNKWFKRVDCGSGEVYEYEQDCQRKAQENAQNLSCQSPVVIEIPEHIKAEVKYQVKNAENTNHSYSLWPVLR